MALSFLLRFQEHCVDPPVGAGGTGTETVTKIAREQSDADPTTPSYRSLPLAELHAGTMTTTRIRSEQGDADRSSTSRVVPLMGTTTKTAVKMETDDQDPRQKELSTIPRCS